MALQRRGDEQGGEKIRKKRGRKRGEEEKVVERRWQ